MRAGLFPVTVQGQIIAAKMAVEESRLRVEVVVGDHMNNVDDMLHYARDFIRLLIQLALLWLTYLAAVRTGLRLRQVVSGPAQSG